VPFCDLLLPQNFNFPTPPPIFWGGAPTSTKTSYSCFCPLCVQHLACFLFSCLDLSVLPFRSAPSRSRYQSQLTQAFTHGTLRVIGAIATRFITHRTVRHSSRASKAPNTTCMSYVCIYVYLYVCVCVCMYCHVWCIYNERRSGGGKEGRQRETEKIRYGKIRASEKEKTIDKEERVG